MKVPSLEKVCQWVVEAWDGLEMEIAKSFKICGLVDNLEKFIDQIHCIKEGNPCESAKPVLVNLLANGEVVTTMDWVEGKSEEQICEIMKMTDNDSDSDSDESVEIDNDN